MSTKVYEMIDLIQGDGWYLQRTKGSHRQFKHPVKKGTVTIAGKPSETLFAPIVKSIKKQAGLL